MNINKTVLTTKLESDLEICAFSDDVQKGLLFFMGLSVNNTFNRQVEAYKHSTGDEDIHPNLLIRTITSYSESSGDMEDYEDFNYGVVGKLLYNTNYILLKYFLGDEINLDDKLRKLPITDMIVGKEDIDNDYVETFKGQSLNLNNIYNLIEVFFSKIGNELNRAGFSNKKSYEAGVAYFNMQIPFDINGTFFMINTITEILPPLFLTLNKYPVLYTLYPKAFETNHLFTQLLHSITPNLSSKVLNSIVFYHEAYFYEEKSPEFKVELDLMIKELPAEDLIYEILSSSMSMRYSDFLDDEHRKAFQNENNISLKHLRGVDITLDDFINDEIIKLIKEKYGIEISEFGWNDRGDLIQAMAILYYETCIHVLLPNNFIDS